MKDDARSYMKDEKRDFFKSYVLTFVNLAYLTLNQTAAVSLCTQPGVVSTGWQVHLLISTVLDSY